MEIIVGTFKHGEYKGNLYTESRFGGTRCWGEKIRETNQLDVEFEVVLRPKRADN